MAKVKAGPERAKAIRVEYSNGATIKELKAKHKVTEATLSAILNGKSYPDAGGPLKGQNGELVKKRRSSAPADTATARLQQYVIDQALNQMETAKRSLLELKASLHAEG